MNSVVVQLTGWAKVLSCVKVLMIFTDSQAKDVHYRTFANHDFFIYLE